MAGDTLIKGKGSAQQNKVASPSNPNMINGRPAPVIQAQVAKPVASVSSRSAAPAKAAPAKSRQAAPAKPSASYAGTAKPVSYGSAPAVSAAPSQISSFGGGGGSADFAAPAEIAPPVPQFETITIPDAMADPTYQQQQALLAQQMADFKAQQDLADAQYTGSYNQTTRKLGRNGDKWDPTLQNGQYGETVNANTNDFAGRGLYNSGEYAKSQSNVDADFNSRLGEIDRARTDFKDTAALSARNMGNQQEAQRQQALAQAVASIAAQYGVNLDQVGRGQQNQIQRAI
jgi:hypothetical protein